MDGWIKLHRSILKHWIFQDAEKFKWWIDLLLLVNHETHKVTIGNMIFEVKRGETIRSLQQLSLRWMVTRGRVRRFLQLLEQDKMICVKDERKTTRITICNYDNYQGEWNANGTRVERKRNASGHKQEGIESKQLKEINIVFENFRKEYPGTKRGYQVELETLQKHKDWKDIIPILSTELKRQTAEREAKRRAGQFVPEWKNLKTYLNNRSWEETYGAVQKEKLVINTTQV